MHDLLLFSVGIIVGVMNAIAGGGMLLGFPVLVATGMPPLIANATTGLIVLPGQLSSAFGYRKYIKKLPPHYLLLTIPCFLGGWLGAHLLRQTSPEQFADIVPWLLFFAVLLFAYQPLFHHYVHKYVHEPRLLRKHVRPLVLIGLGTIPIAMYGGYFGAGFGFIMLAFLGFTRIHSRIHQMNALKNVMAVCIAVAAIITLLGSGLIDWRNGLIMASGGLIGGYAGAVGAQKVSSNIIRITVVAIGLTAAAYLAIHTYYL